MRECEGNKKKETYSANQFKANITLYFQTILKLYKSKNRSKQRNNIRNYDIDLHLFFMNY